MKIVRVVRKDNRNVAVHLDNDEILFLSKEIFLKSGLRKEDEISEGRLSSLIKENRLFYLKQKAFRYLGRRLHSVKELRMKLRGRDYDVALIDIVLKELSDNNYLNDYEFAVQFAEENIKNKLWGRTRVKAELSKRGVESSIIDKVISEKFSDEDILENAVSLVRKKIKTIDAGKYGPEKVKQKLFSFLANKGYDYEVIRQATEIIFNENNNFEKNIEQ